MSSYVLMEYYIRYLRDVRKLSESSIKHYLDALKYISKFLEERRMIESTVYEINDMKELESVMEYLYHEPDFVDLDSRGHRMYSAGLNNYFKFANGEEFYKYHKELQILDIEIPVGEKITSTTNVWKRSEIIKKQTIESAGYACEINNTHNTFIAESTQQPYMEGHHAIPMRVQEHFDNSLDVYANVVCLCPTCHRLLHYGIKTEKIILLNQIYSERSERLEHSGIRLSKQEFIDIAI